MVTVIFQVVELGKIVSLLLSLSGRLVRVENALLSLDWNGVEEREELEARRAKLMAQLDEASMLKESIDRRSKWQPMWSPTWGGSRGKSSRRSLTPRSGSWSS